MSSNDDTRAPRAEYDVACEGSAPPESQALIRCEGLPAGQSEDEEELARRWEALNNHRTTCQALHVGMDKVSPEELASAAMSQDAYSQIERLAQVFEVLSLTGDGNEGRRVDLIRRVAKVGPRSEDEMHCLLVRECGRIMQFRQVEAITSSKQPHAASQGIAALGKLIQIDESLSRRIDAMRGKDEPAPLALHGHLHIHTAAEPVPDRDRVVDGNCTPQPPPGLAQDLSPTPEETPSNADLAGPEPGHDPL